MSETERIKQVSQALALLRVAKITITDAKRHLDHAQVAGAVLDRCEETEEWLDRLIPRMTTILDSMDTD